MALKPPRLPRIGRVSNFPKKPINPTKHALLEAVGRYHYLTAEQLARLLGRTSTLRYIRQQLSDLYQMKYLERAYPTLRVGEGSSPATYRLDKDGYNYLKELELEPEGRFRASEAPSGISLRHTLATNDLLIATELLAARHPAISLAHFLTELQLNRQHVTVELETGPADVAVDAWIDLRIDQVEQLCICFEVDRNSEQRVAFQRKVLKLLRFSQGPYQQAFGTGSLTLAFVVTPPAPKRLGEILRWTEETLTKEQEQAFGEVFCFATFDTAKAEPEEILLAPIWARPFRGTRLSLLEFEPQ